MAVAQRLKQAQVLHSSTVLGYQVWHNTPYPVLVDMILTVALLLVKKQHLTSLTYLKYQNNSLNKIKKLIYKYFFFLS